MNYFRRCSFPLANVNNQKPFVAIGERQNGRVLAKLHKLLVPVEEINHKKVDRATSPLLKIQDGSGLDLLITVDYSNPFRL